MLAAARPDICLRVSTEVALPTLISACLTMCGSIRRGLDMPIHCQLSSPLESELEQGVALRAALAKCKADDCECEKHDGAATIRDARGHRDIVHQSLPLIVPSGECQICRSSGWRKAQCRHMIPLGIIRSDLILVASRKRKVCTRKRNQTSTPTDRKDIIGDCRRDGVGEPETQVVVLCCNCCQHLGKTCAVSRGRRLRAERCRDFKILRCQIIQNARPD